MFSLVLALTRRQKQAILLCIDLALILISLLVALALVPLAPGTLAATTPGLTALALTMVSAGALFSSLLELPRIKLNAFEQQAIIRTILFAGLVGLTGGLTLPLLLGDALPGLSMVIFTMVLVLLTVSAKFAMRHALLHIYLRGQTRTRVLIYGAGQTGIQLAAALKTDDMIVPVAFVDDNSALHRMMVAGLPVHSPVHIEKLIRDRQISRVVLAMPSINRPKQARIIRRLTDLGCDVRTLPSFATLLGETDLLTRIEPVDPGDYLNRSGAESDLHGFHDIYAGQAVMITGAGGSIGSELCRQVLACKPRVMILFEISELALYQIERELIELAEAARATETRIVAVMGSVTDAAVLDRVLAEHGVGIVLHTAAYKHVSMVERNQLVALRNNVLGTQILADCARKAMVSHFILISSDKAVRPTNVMGASKRLAELIVQDLATRSKDTRFSMVRFGNVLGSSGSVIPLFEEQIARGGPVTLSHTEVSRYFMTIGEAARLVLLAGSYTCGGEVFVLDMGSPVPIRRLARQMIEAAGYSICDAAHPDGDIEIVITGLRPGEKLHEELVISGDLRGTAHPKILQAHEARLSEIEIATALRDLRSAIDTGSTARAQDVISRWVEHYVPHVPTPSLSGKALR